LMGGKRQVNVQSKSLYSNRYFRIQILHTTHRLL
jgi:hypothetical protein